MNQKSLEKIQAAIPFLRWFRQDLPPSVQNHVRPYLDQPYQLALKVLDCCNGPEYHTIEEIATAVETSKGTTQQVLNTLRKGGIVLIIKSTKGSQPIELTKAGLETSKMQFQDSDSYLEDDSNLGKQLYQTVIPEYSTESSAQKL